MTMDMDKIIGKALIRDGKLTPRQFDELLEKCDATHTSFHDILIEKGIADAVTLNKIRSQAKKDSLRLSPLSDVKSSLFGEKAMDIYNIPKSEIDRCLEIQKEKYNTDKHMPHLGEIMIAEGVMTPTMVKELLLKQNKMIVSCVDCGTRYNIKEDDISRICPRCGGVLNIIDFFDSDIRIERDVSEQPPA